MHFNISQHLFYVVNVRILEWRSLVHGLYMKQALKWPEVPKFSFWVKLEGLRPVLYYFVL